MRVDPHLTARVLGVWLRDFSVKKYTVGGTRETCAGLCRALAETTGGLDARAARLLEEAASTMACDDNFVKRGLLEKVLLGFQGGLSRHRTAPTSPWRCLSCHSVNIYSWWEATPFRVSAPLLPSQFPEKVTSRACTNTVLRLITRAQTS